MIRAMRWSGVFAAGGLLAITLIWTLAFALTGSSDPLLFLAPALLIALPLVFGCFPGEDVLDSLRRSPSRRPAAARPAPAPVPSGLAPLLPRGGTLLASALAGRAPPAFASSA
jgi:hypothetical protein